MLFFLCAHFGHRIIRNPKVGACRAPALDQFLRAQLSVPNIGISGSAQRAFGTWGLSKPRIVGMKKMMFAAWHFNPPYIWTSV